jgi:hypothetical protein
MVFGTCCFTNALFTIPTYLAWEKGAFKLETCGYEE